MTCEAIHLWTFNGLVAAYLDLSVAYLLLCASTLVFSTSKFLGLFGLCLPCPCDGLFGNLSSDHCLQKLLVDSSSKRMSSVLYSVKEKCPFDSMLNKERNCCFNSMLQAGRNGKDRHIELEGEVSCSSETKMQGMVDGTVPDIKEPDAVVGSISSKEGGNLHSMGNRVSSQKTGNSLHHRREHVIGHGKVVSESSNGILQLDMEGIFQSPTSINGFGDDDTEDSFFSVDSGGGREASTENSDQDKIFHDLQLDDSHDENICSEMDESCAEEAGNRGELAVGFDVSESDTLRLLEQTLEEEQSTRANLYLELEKERSAAATAADEAMAMILRLQEEKAFVEMEARQYQRMIEEKTAYDAEEMNILKEILVRREREMHFLEKEVEAYRKNILVYAEADPDMFDMAATPQVTSSLLHSADDPSHMLRYINRSDGEKQDANYVKGSSEHEIPSLESRNLALEFGEICMDQGVEVHPHKFNGSEEITNDLEEKGMVSVDETKREASPHFDNSDELDMDEKSIISVRDDHEKLDNVLCEGSVLSKTVLSPIEYNVEIHGDYQKLGPKDLDAVTVTDPHSHDIHVIVDEAKTYGESSVDASKEPVANGNLSNPVKCDSPFSSLLDSELDIRRSSSDATGRFPPTALSRGNRLHSELRRNSMSAFDYERSKIGSEVEWLRERLKVVREGREKLNFTMEYREKETTITNHLPEIRHLTDSGKAVLQASLPPSSKAMFKKRCWRSSSLSIHRSN